MPALARRLTKTTTDGRSKLAPFSNFTILAISLFKDRSLSIRQAAYGLAGIPVASKPEAGVSDVVQKDEWIQPHPSGRWAERPLPCCSEDMFILAPAFPP